jgi:hypothetical protein
VLAWLAHYTSITGRYAAQKLVFQSEAVFDLSQLTVYDPGYTADMVIFDVHSHSQSSDGRMTVDELIQWHILYGYTAFVLSDHNTFGDIELAQELARTKYGGNIIVIPGVEWTTCRFHMNFIGIASTDVLPSWNLFTLPSWEEFNTGKYFCDQLVRQIIGEVHAAGGLVSFNHRRWSEDVGFEVWSMDKLVAFGVDFIEAVNPDGIDLQAVYYCHRVHNQIGVAVGTDVHDGFMIPHGWGILNASNFTEQAIMTELRHHRGSFIYSQVDVPQLVSQDATPDAAYEFNYFWTGLGELITTYWTYHNNTSCQGWTSAIEFHHGMIWGTIFWIVSLVMIFEIVHWMLLSAMVFVVKWLKTKIRNQKPIKSLSTSQ